MIFNSKNGNRLAHQTCGSLTIRGYAISIFTQRNL
jgi:hypothetical protein